MNSTVAPQALQLLLDHVELLALANTPPEQLDTSTIDNATFTALNDAAATILHAQEAYATLVPRAQQYWDTRAADAVARGGYRFAEGLAIIAGLEECARCGRRYAEPGHTCNAADSTAYAIERAVRAILALNAGERTALDDWMRAHESWGQQIVRRIAFDVSQSDYAGIATRCQVLLIAGLLGAHGASPDLLSDEWSATLTAALRTQADWLTAEADLEAIAVQTFLEQIPAQNWGLVRTTVFLLIGYGWSTGLTQPFV